MGKKPSKKEPGITLKEELKQIVPWGRDAYDDDGYEEDSDSDSDPSLGQTGQWGSQHKAEWSKAHNKRLTKKKRSPKEEEKRENKALGGTPKKGARSSPRQRRRLGERRQLTPMPYGMPLFNLKSDMPSPKKLDFDSTGPLTPPPTPSPTSPSPPPVMPATTSLKPVRSAPPPPVTSTAPISKVASARVKSSHPKKLPAPSAPVQLTPRPPQVMSTSNHALPLSYPQSNGSLPTEQLRRSLAGPTPLSKVEAGLGASPGGRIPPHHLPSQNLAMQVMQGSQSRVEEEKEEEEVKESDSDDDSFTSSSEENDSDTSDTEESSEEEEDSMVHATKVEAPQHVTIPMRPMMAMNRGMFGARRAKQAMMRMKVARYPRILRRPIVNLDTIDEVRDEVIHETVSYKVSQSEYVH